jgi:hypothetical protein
LATWIGIHNRERRVFWIYESVYDWVAREIVVNTFL